MECIAVDICYPVRARLQKLQVEIKWPSETPGAWAPLVPVPRTPVRPPPSVPPLSSQMASKSLENQWK